MQCFLIFDHLNDVIYYKQNNKFHLYIRKHCIKEGFLQEEDEFSRPGTLDYNNALVQMFSPIIASQRIMINQFNSPYSGITCDDGTKFTFADYLSYMIVGIGKGENVTEAFLLKKLRIFLRLATFLCGPTLNVLRMSSPEFLEKRNLLGKLLDSWDFLYKKDLAFHLEAQERLLTNSELSGKWVKLLQNVLEKLRSGIPDASPCHAFILVKTKVLTWYSRNTGSISDGDLLLLILLTFCNNNENCILEDSDLRQESTNSSDSEQYFSPCASPAVPDSGSRLSFASEEIPRVLKVKTIEPKNLEFPKLKETDLADGFVDISTDFKSNLVFLQSSFNTLVPYIVHHVFIIEGIILVTISAVNKHVLSSSLVSGIETLHMLQNVFSDISPKGTMDLLDSNVRSITDSLKKQKIDGESEIYIKRIQSCWEITKKSGLLDYLKNKSQNGMTSKLERSIVQLGQHLIRCFQKYCVVWNYKAMHVNGPLIDAQALVRYSLADYMEYLKVKGEQNISMANYYADFAGMVHFIFVDRSSNQIIVPSMDIVENKSHTFYSQKQNNIFKKLCYMVDKAWTHVLKGHTTVIWRDDCYHYSYFLWFEDAVGNPCKPLVPCISVEGIVQPGIISSNFYKLLIQKCFPSSPDFIRCYELYCLHLASVPPIIINNHARRLTARVWELSGASQSPVDLLL